MKFPLSRTLREWLSLYQLKKEIASAGWSFSDFRLKMILWEIADWKEYYLPINIEGKIVLDVGAGEGETAMFFLKNGARQVICIEPDCDSYRRLKRNMVAHKEIISYNRCFRLSDLDLLHDFLKMDIEGYEESLLNVTLKTPAVLEIHGLQLRDKFKDAGYRIVFSSVPSPRRSGYLSYAYWKC